MKQVCNIPHRKAPGRGIQYTSVAPWPAVPQITTNDIASALHHSPQAFPASSPPQQKKEAEAVGWRPSWGWPNPLSSTAT